MRAARRVLRRHRDGQTLLRRLETCCDELDCQLTDRMALLQLGDVPRDVADFEVFGTGRIRPTVDGKRRIKGNERLTALHSELVQRLEALEAKLGADRKERDKYPPWAVEMVLERLDLVCAENKRLVTRLSLAAARQSDND